MDLNPLLVSSQGITALDARIVLHEPLGKGASYPKPAIRPYPLQYVGPHILKNGERVTLRPIRPEDETLMVKFHETLSEQSVYLRYFQQMNLGQRVAHNRLIRLCFIDYLRHMALVAENTKPGGGSQLLGVGRLSRLPQGEAMEFSILVADPWQRQGLGFELLRRLVEIGRQESLKRILGYILPENAAMLAISRKLGFKIHYSKDHQAMVAILDL